MTARKSAAPRVQPQGQQDACPCYGSRVDREEAARAIVEEARKVRPRTSRTTWLLAGVVGAICLIAFVLILVVDGEPASTPATAPQPHGLGFATGLAIGIGVGIVIGLAIARQISRSPHSSRSRP